MMSTVEFEHELIKMLGWNQKQEVAARKFCNIKRMTFIQLIRKGSFAYMNSQIEPDFMGIETAREMRQEFTRAFSG